jgi:hypothetical protein
MITSIFLAKALSIYFVIIGLGLLLRKDHFREIIKAFFSRKASLFLGGWLALIVGILMIAAHPRFTADWRSWITVIGYLSLLEGITYLFVIDNFIAFKSNLISRSSFYYVTGIILVVLGIYLGWHGWFV